VTQPVALVRVARGDADVEAMTELRRRWTEERRGVGADPGFAGRFRAWFQAEAHQRTFWLALLDDAPIGMTNLLTFERMPGPEIDAGRWGYLGNMYVAPEHRDAGIGRQLLDAVVAHADAHGLERIVLSPSERSVPFYRRAGFDDAYQLLVRPHTT
jgi:GNAT superfamily N-acetyltransferase